jgi:NAD(P)-dependent dehydrogenase (short-subunit alcohol dehydrogenase family)
MPELIVVTGASRGLGKAIALGLANAFPTAEFIFTSTKLPDLELVQQEVKTISNSIHSHVMPCDWSDRSTMAENARNLFGLVRPAVSHSSNFAMQRYPVQSSIKRQ